MVNYNALKDRIMAEIEAQGLEITNKSGVKSLQRVIKLTDMVRTVMSTSGIPDDETDEVMLASASNLAHAWHKYDEDAKAIVERYLRKKDQEGDGKKDDDRGDDDDNDDDPTEGGEGGFGKYEPVPTPTPTPTPTPVPTPVPVPVPVPIPPVPPKPEEPEMSDEEIAPEDMPVDPDYIPPKVWNKVIAVIKWNLTHPGKQKNIMLVGPRGIGKTEMMFQIAKKFYQSIPHVITSPQADHKLTGYGDAMGHEVKSQFSEGYTEAGIVGIEEIDRSEPSPLISINMATANKYMDVPIRGMIQQHPLCTIMATANTSGTGATDEYVTANQLDASTRDRWIYIKMDWEHDTAVKVAKGDTALVDGLEDWNASCEKNGYISATASYRAITDIHDLLDTNAMMGGRTIYTYKDALRSALLKYAIPKSNMMTILDGMAKTGTQFYRTLKEICDELPDIETGMA